MKIVQWFNKSFDTHLILTSLIALVLFVFSAKVFAQSPNLIKVDGSSTVYPITEAVAEEYQAEYKNKWKVTVGISGTGGGFKKFCRGETDIQNASRPIQKKELADCKEAKINFFEVPIAFDATVVVVNPKANWISEITTEELKKMWEPVSEGKIKNWNQINAKWPDRKLTLYGAGSDSGTFDYFTEAIVGKAKSSRGDYTASEDDNTLVTGIANDVNALGYLPLSYYEANKNRLKVLAIIGGEKSPGKMKGIMPTIETVESGSYFPLSRPLFVYVSEKSFERPEVKSFAEFYVKNAARLVQEVKYVPLPSTAYKLASEHLAKKKLGTVFDGHSEVGMKIEDLMKKESKF